MVIDAYLSAFLVCCILVSYHPLYLSKPQSPSRQLSPSLALILVVASAFLFIYLLLNSSATFTSRLAFAAFAASIISFAASWSRHPRIRITAFATAILLILSRLLTNHDLVHNLFMTATITWLGPVLIALNFLTRRRFLILAFAWFLYDVAFVWLSQAAVRVVTTTLSFNLPLGITSRHNLIGSGDLLFASIFISLTPPPLSLLGCPLSSGYTRRFGTVCRPIGNFGFSPACTVGSSHVSVLAQSPLCRPFSHKKSPARGGGKRSQKSLRCGRKA